MTQIKIEVPSNDPIALSALGEALQRIAAERKGEQPYKRDIDAILNAINDKVEAVKNDSVLKAIQELQPVPQASADLSQSVKFEDIEPSGPTIEEMTDDGTLSPLPTDDVKVCETATDFVNACAGDLTEQVNQLHEQIDASGDVKVPDALPTDDTLDKDGLPWDKRIHSRGKTRLADDTWRLARKPNDKTQEEWDEYVASVKAELKAVQDIPVPSDTVTPPVVEPTLEEVGYDANAPVDDNLTPPVAETEVVTPPTLDEQAVADVQASEPVAAVEPPTSVTAPVVESNEQLVNGKPYSEVIKAGSEFQSLMMYITQSKQRGLTVDMVNEALLEVSPNLNKLPLIATNLKLIPTFVAKLEAKLS